MPRLTDFDPQWIDTPDRKGIGFTFRCVTGHCPYRCIVLFANPLDGGPPFVGATISDQSALVGSIEHAHTVRGCGAMRWDRTGETFETLSLSPSVDAHQCGHFTIVNGGW